MTQRDDLLSDADLDSLFAEAQSETVQPSNDFMARVLADADATQQALGAGIPAWAAAKDAPVRRSWFAQLLEGIGGWRGGAGLATATVMGLGIGLGAPTTVSQFTTDAFASASLTVTDTTDTETLSYALDDLVPSFYDLAAEG